MDNSILTSIKKLLGIAEADTSFDEDIIIHINTVFAILAQIGVGTSSFSIEDDGATWGDYLSTATNLELVKSYIYMKVRLMFDPPQSSSLLEAMNRATDELEWRISATVDPGD